MNDTMVGNHAQGSSRDDVHARWGPHAPGYEPVFARLSPYTDLVHALVESQRDSRTVLDLGCGIGTLARALGESGTSVLAVESDEATVRAAAGRRAPRVVFRRMDLERLDLPSGVVDGVVSCDVLYALPDPLAALAEVRRVLAPGGLFAVASLRRGFDPAVLDRRLGFELAEAEDPVLERSQGERLVRHHALVRDGHAHVYDPEEFAALLLAEFGFRQILECRTAYLDQDFFVVVRR